MTKKCICQLCTCGRHKCPHYPRGGQISVQPCTISEYSNKYQPHAVEARQNCKPEAKPVHNEGPFEDKTTHKVDFVEHPMERPYVHQSEKYQKPMGEFDMTTNYNTEYNQKPLDVVKMIRPTESKKNHGRFEGLPTYTHDYRKWDTQPRGQYGPSDTYQPSTVPFDGDTNYNREFVKHDHAMRASMKPNERPMNSGAFDDATDYKQSYIKHNLPEKFVKEKVSWEPSLVPFGETSHYTSDYTRKQGGGQLASFKPDNKPYSSAAPFDDSTTQKIDYKQWPMEKLSRKEYEAYKKPEGDMYMDTTSHTDYDRKHGEMAKAIRPLENRKVHGQFDGTTNYSMEFKPKAVDRVYPNARESYVPNEAPFDGMPMYTTDYVKHASQLTKSLKPTDRNYKSDEPWQDATEYKQEFFRKKVEPCPTISLQSDPKYTYVQDDSGHKWYNINNGITAAN